MPPSSLPHRCVCMFHTGTHQRTFQTQAVTRSRSSYTDHINTPLQLFFNSVTDPFSFWYRWCPWCWLIRPTWRDSMDHDIFLLSSDTSAVLMIFARSFAESWIWRRKQAELNWRQNPTKSRFKISKGWNGLHI